MMPKFLEDWLLSLSPRQQREFYAWFCLRDSYEHVLEVLIEVLDD